MKFFLAGLLLFAASAPSWACDVCGGISGNQSLGILPQYSNHFVGVQYQIRHFSSIHPALAEGEDEYSDEYYRMAQLWGRYNAGKRLRLFAFLPYYTNTQVIKDGARVTNSGIGDASVLANYVILSSADTSSANLKHRLQAGGGLKLPTGKFEKGNGTTDLPMMQPGTGSWDFILNANYTLRGKNAGLLVDATYTVTTPNSSSYKYGNRLMGNMLGFYTWQLSPVTVVMQTGGQYEFALHDYDNFSKKWLNEDTGGSMLFGVLGFQAIYKKVGLQCSVQTPLWQQYGGGHVQVKYKGDMGFFFMM